MLKGRKKLTQSQNNFPKISLSPWCSKEKQPFLASKDTSIENSLLGEEQSNEDMLNINNFVSSLPQVKSYRIKKLKQVHNMNVNVAQQFSCKKTEEKLNNMKKISNNQPKLTILQQTIPQTVGLQKETFQNPITIQQQKTTKLNTQQKTQHFHPKTQIQNILREETKNLISIIKSAHLTRQNSFSKINAAEIHQLNQFKNKVCHVSIEQEKKQAKCSLTNRQNKLNTYNTSHHDLQKRIQKIQYSQRKYDTKIGNSSQKNMKKNNKQNRQKFSIQSLLLNKKQTKIGQSSAKWCALMQANINTNLNTNRYKIKQQIQSHYNLSEVTRTTRKNSGFKRIVLNSLLL